MLRILLDTASLKSLDAKRLLSYDDHELFEFISIGPSSKHTQLEINKDDIGRIEQLGINKKTYSVHFGFNYLNHVMETLSKGLDIELDDLMNIFYLSTLLTDNDQTLLVTEREKLINRKFWGHSFSAIQAKNVLSPREANIFIDLYCKKQNKYIAAPHYFLSEWLWYLYSMKNKTKKYQLPWSIIVFSEETEIPDKRAFMDMMGALSDRLVDVLTAIDEMGQQYYLGVNNNTQSKVVYHFNYWLTLYAGVMDNLALITQLRYQIPFIYVEKISLSKRRGKDYLKIVFQKNYKLDSFLAKKSNIVNLVYGPRNLVIHRERLKVAVMDNRNDGFYLNMMKISADFFSRIVSLSKLRGDTLNRWGHYHSHNEYYLEPYRFVKEATLELINFVNEYLEILDFEEYLKLYPDIAKRIQDSKSKSTHKNYEQSLAIFKDGNLGY